MAVVALIPTGKLEHAALEPALGWLFSNDTFVVRPPEDTWTASPLGMSLLLQLIRRDRFRPIWA
jgi:hypothetical protein